MLTNEIPPRIPLSTKRCFSKSVNNSSSTRSFSRARPKKGLATCNNVPDLNHTALGTVFESFQKHLPAVRRPFLRKDRGSCPEFCIQKPSRRFARARTLRLLCIHHSACCKTIVDVIFNASFGVALTSESRLQTVKIQTVNKTQTSDRKCRPKMLCIFPCFLRCISPLYPVATFFALNGARCSL